MSKKITNEEIRKRIKNQAKNVSRINNEKAINQARDYGDKRCNNLKNFEDSQACSQQVFKEQKRLNKINEKINRID